MSPPEFLAVLYTDGGEAGARGVVTAASPPGVARAREVHALMKTGALDGLSIGFRTIRARQDAKTGVRRILEADLWEISVVTFPMLPSARISNVKQARFFRDRDTELVRALRRASKTMLTSHMRG